MKQSLNVLTPPLNNPDFIMHQTALRINKKSWSSGENYHVGMNGLDLTITHKPGWTIKTEVIVDKHGNAGLRVWHERVIN